VVEGIHCARRKSWCFRIFLVLIIPSFLKSKKKKENRKKEIDVAAERHGPEGVPTPRRRRRIVRAPAEESLKK
jgi:hypothetical protein